jgi:hypothetical protein
VRFQAKPVPFDPVDASQRLSDLPPMVRRSFNGLDCLKHQETSTRNRNDADGRGRQDARTFSEKPQSCQLNLELLDSIRRFAELGKNRKGTIREDCAGMTGKLGHVPCIFYHPLPPYVYGHASLDRGAKGMAG